MQHQILRAQRQRALHLAAKGRHRFFPEQLRLAAQVHEIAGVDHQRSAIEFLAERAHLLAVAPQQLLCPPHPRARGEDLKGVGPDRVRPLRCTKHATRGRQMDPNALLFHCALVYRRASGGYPEPSVTDPTADTQTPLMRQYLAAKHQHPDALLFFRLGDFYELFFDDAKTASRELQLTLTARDKERNTPMCGVPWHAAENYIARLLRLGYRVAICDQMEDPKLTKKIVRREVTRVLTPGTALDPALAAEQSNYLAAVHLTDTTAGVAVLDLSTADFRATEFAGPGAAAQALEELLRLAPAELIFPTTRGPFGPKTDSVSLDPLLAQIKTRSPGRRLRLLRRLCHPVARAPAWQRFS